MLRVTDIIEKLKDILNKKELYNKVLDKDVATVLDISQANLATMKLRNKIPYLEILDFCAIEKISINWLLYNQDPNSLIENTDKYWIKYYPDLAMSAGGGAIMDSENIKYLNISDYFAKSLINHNKLKYIEAMNVTGDSMEPTLYDSDIIFIDTSIKQCNKNGVYAIYTTDGLLVKRIEKKENGQYDIISDNPMFENQLIYKKNLTVYGKVVRSFGSIF